MHILRRIQQRNRSLQIRHIRSSRLNESLSISFIDKHSANLYEKLVWLRSEDGTVVVQLFSSRNAKKEDEKRQEEQLRKGTLSLRNERQYTIYCVDILWVAAESSVCKSRTTNVAQNRNHDMDLVAVVGAGALTK